LCCRRSTFRPEARTASSAHSKLGRPDFQAPAARNGGRFAGHCVAKAHPGIRFNEHVEGDGPTVFAHACKLGLEGIVSKRKDSAYRFGRSPDWLKMKNPACAAVTREAEEDWAR
jgi:hypothetical protein